ncbi:MAG TPA: hypothetical protein VIL74_02080 [Pyrinomonadaceae bacterium]|jgi:hypothetical protein
MLKSTSVLLFVVLVAIVPLHAQSLPDVPRPRAAQTDLRNVVSRETQKIRSESLAVDAKKMEKLRRQVPRGNWTKAEKTLVILTIVGIAALVFLLIKYGKDCVRYENDCSPADENCYCAEYERREEGRRLVAR